MTTVPNWIPRAVIYKSPYGTQPAKVVPTAEWRATKTQVIVKTKHGVEYRFRLDNLTEVGNRHSGFTLMAPDDERVVAAVAAARVRRAIDTARSVQGVRLDSSMNAEAAAVAITEIRDLATKALAALAEVL